MSLGGYYGTCRVASTFNPLDKNAFQPDTGRGCIGFRTVLNTKQPRPAAVRA